MEPAESEGHEGQDDDVDEDKPAKNAIQGFVASNLHKRGNQGTWKGLQQGQEEEGKEGAPPRR